MASNIFTVNNVDLDTLLEAPPNSQYSAREKLKDDTSGIFPYGATVVGEVYASDGQSVWDRYLSNDYGNSLSGDTIGIWCEVQGNNDQGQPTGTIETVRLEDYVAVDGGGVPTFTPSSQTFTESKHTNTGSPFTFSKQKGSDASSFPVTNSTLVSASITPPTNPKVILNYSSGYPTVNNSGLVDFSLDFINDATTTGSEVHVLTVKYTHSNAYGTSQEFTMTVNLTVDYADSGGGFPT